MFYKDSAPEFIRLEAYPLNYDKLSNVLTLDLKVHFGEDEKYSERVEMTTNFLKSHFDIIAEELIRKMKFSLQKYGLVEYDTK